jgi:hypothetical protein
VFIRNDVGINLSETERVLTQGNCPLVRICENIVKMNPREVVGDEAMSETRGAVQ